MSQSEGLAKLTEYLHQTRQQAERSIDTLNERVREVEAERDTLREERDYYYNSCEQLKFENSKKGRLQERDEWKALLESVQIDRKRLQEDCYRLNIALEESQAEVKVLEEEIKMRNNNLQHDEELDDNNNNNNGGISCEENGTHQGGMVSDGVLEGCSVYDTITSSRVPEESSSLLNKTFYFPWGGGTISSADRSRSVSVDPITSPPTKQVSFDGSSSSGTGTTNNSIVQDSTTPRAVSRKLQLELQKTITQVM